MNTPEKATQKLVGLPLWASGRAGSVQWFQFGPRRIVATHDGGTNEVGEYALHVQCSWRIRRANGIVVGSGDTGLPAEDTAIGLSEFETDQPGATRCDRLIDEVFGARAETPMLVKRVVLDANGTLQVILTGDFTLEVFPDSAALDQYDEYWRLFSPGEDDGHVVVPNMEDLP